MLHRFVVDASVAIKWVAREDDDDRARALLSEDVDRHAPTLLLAELTNVTWKKHRTRLMMEASARAAIAGAPLYVSLHEAQRAGQALSLAIELDHPAYDCFYLALAIDLDCRLVTADARFLARVATSAHAGRVMKLADWSTT